MANETQSISWLCLAVILIGVGSLFTTLVTLPVARERAKQAEERLDKIENILSQK